MNDEESETQEEINNQTTKDTNTLNCIPKLVCVTYPGIVNNVDKAIETLGGIKGIELATGSQKKNLELHFRPKNDSSKPCPADSETKPSILLKAKIKKKLVDGKVIEGSQEVVDYDVVGVTALSFKFNKLCDFQYLPLLPKESAETEDELNYIYEKIIPNDLPDGNWFTNEESENMELYLPPSIFSKFNSTKHSLYFDRSKFYEGRFTPEYYKKFQEHEIQQKIERKGRDRSIMHHGGFICNFEDDVPLTPPQSIIELSATKYIKEGASAKLKELFEQRPIWSKQALHHFLDITIEQMKYLLPTIAFYYVSGPWRVMWVRFGYDPTKDPNARIYQTFDYRIRAKCGFKLKVRAKRSYTSNVLYPAQGGGSTFSFKDDHVTKKSNRVQKNSYMLKPGMIPTARQMFYQYCDIHLPEIETMLARLPPMPPGTKCNKKNGWLPSGFTEQCREIANRYIGEQVQKELQLERENMDEEMATEEKNLAEGEESPNEYYKISDSSSSSSDSEDGAKANADNTIDSENEIDMETVEEVNKIIELSSTANKPFIKDICLPGPSGILNE